MKIEYLTSILHPDPVNLLYADVLHRDGPVDEKKIFVEKDPVKKQKQKDIIVGKDGFAKMYTTDRNL